MSRSRKQAAQPKKEINPIVAEFTQCCKVAGFTDEDIINEITNSLNKSETVIRLVHQNMPPQLCKAFLRLFQRYQRLQQIILYACPVLDPQFYKQLASEFGKCPATNLCLDFMPIQRDTIIPFLSAQSLDVLSLRGNQCLTSYNYVTHEKGIFPQSLNMFLNALAISNIKVLNLYGCHLGDDGAIGLANCLYFNTNLLCLCLSRNRIGDAGAIALASALSNYVLNEQETAIVERLENEESKQRISDEGGGLIKRRKGQKPPPKKPPARNMKKGQQHNRSNQEKSLNFDPAAPVMAAVLTKWNTCVAEANNTKILPGNVTLTSLILDENLITETGAAALQKMLNENTHLVNFSIKSNLEIDPEIAESMTRRIPTSPEQTQ